MLHTLSDPFVHTPCCTMPNSPVPNCLFTLMASAGMMCLLLGALFGEPLLAFDDAPPVDAPLRLPEGLAMVAFTVQPEFSSRLPPITVGACSKRLILLK